MHKILNCTNLLGDSLYLIKPVQTFLEKYPGEAVVVVADRGLSFELFSLSITGVPVVPTLEEAVELHPLAQVMHLQAGKAGELAFAYSRTQGKPAMHISEAYAAMLGLPYPDSIAPTTDWQRPSECTDMEPCILLSPFSRSCSVHTTGVRNKTLEDWKWEHFIRYLRKQSLPIKVIGAPDDFIHCSLPIDAYTTAHSLLELESILRSARLFVSVDNGLGHLASSMNLPMISLWSKAASLEFIGPVYGRRTMLLQFSTPAEAAPAAMMVGFRKFTEMLLEGIYVR